MEISSNVIGPNFKIILNKKYFKFIGEFEVIAIVIFS